MVNRQYSDAKESSYALVALVGETASGKSAYALDIAQEYDGEIICADSMTVYTGFDIGTAKPSVRERQLVPHHLLDVTTADKGFAAPEFQALAVDAIRDIQRRGKLPILVGGSGLYVDSVLYSYQFLQKSDAYQRQLLEKLDVEQLQAIAIERNLDLERIDRRNKRRIIRLIENDGTMPTRQSLLPGTLFLGINNSRDELDAHIHHRVERMLTLGLADEVSQLANKYGWDVEPMKSIGYREWSEYFSGHQTIQITRERIIAGTRRLAKKQRTWFGRNRDIYWVTSVDEAREFLSN